MTDELSEAETAEHTVPMKTARGLPRPAQWAVLLTMGLVVGGVFGSVSGLAGQLFSF